MWLIIIYIQTLVYRFAYHWLQLPTMSSCCAITSSSYEQYLKYHGHLRDYVKKYGAKLFFFTSVPVTWLLLLRLLFVLFSVCHRKFSHFGGSKWNKYHHLLKFFYVYLALQCTAACHWLLWFENEDFSYGFDFRRIKVSTEFLHQIFATIFPLELSDCTNSTIWSCLLYVDKSVTFFWVFRVIECSTSYYPSCIWNLFKICKWSVSDNRDNIFCYNDTLFFRVDVWAGNGSRSWTVTYAAIASREIVAVWLHFRLEHYLLKVKMIHPGLNRYHKKPHFRDVCCSIPLMTFCVCVVVQGISQELSYPLTIGKRECAIYSVKIDEGSHCGNWIIKVTCETAKYPSLGSLLQYVGIFDWPSPKTVKLQ